MLDDERYERLQRRAEESNRSIGALMRDAIDVAYPDRRMTRSEALEILLNAPAADHGSPEDVKRDIRSRYERLES